MPTSSTSGAPARRPVPVRLGLALAAAVLSLVALAGARPGTAHAAVACPAGTAAISGTSYKVTSTNGAVTTVSILAGNVAPGDRVEPAFTVAAGCTDVQVSIASYNGTAPNFTVDQTLADSQTGHFAAGNHRLPAVTAPSCYFQVDFVTGAVITDFHNETYSGSNRLISSANGGTSACAPPPPDCPAAQKDQLSAYSFVVSGPRTVTDLRGNVVVGATVTANFTVKDGCRATQVSLASYTAPSATYDVNTVDQQQLFDSATGTFATGQHSLQVTIPGCYFQVDFVHGPVITQLTQGHDYGQGDVLISADNGGTSACTAPPTTGTPPGGGGGTPPGSGGTPPVDTTTPPVTTAPTTTPVTAPVAAAAVVPTPTPTAVLAATTTPTLLKHTAAVVRRPSGCSTTSAPVGLTATNVAKVVFTVDGKRVGTMYKATKGTTWTYRLSTKGLRAGSHRLVATVTFTKAAGGSSKKLAVGFTTCRTAVLAAAASPAFTG